MHSIITDYEKRERERERGRGEEREIRRLKERNKGRDKCKWNKIFSLFTCFSKEYDDMMTEIIYNTQTERNREIEWERFFWNGLQ